MSDGVNRVQLLGHLGADPELRVVGNGNTVLKMRVATTQSWLDKNRVKQQETQWHSVSIWGKRAEALAQFLRSGSKVYIEGSLRYSSWEADDGTKRYRTDIVCSNLVMCSSGTGAGVRGAEPPSGRFSEPDDRDAPVNYDDDIPF